MPLTVFTLGAVPLPAATPLDLGPKHPSRAGRTTLSIEHAGGIVARAEMQPGFLHRGAEKLFEARDYRSVLMLADRHDWHAAFSGELSIALTLESAMRLAPPERATLLRTLYAELARAHSHLSYLAYLPFRFNESSATGSTEDARNQLRELFGEVSGNRVHPMLNRLGGVAHDLTPQASEATHHAIDRVRDAAALLGQLLDANRSSLAAIGTLTRDDVLGLGLSGPTSAASGVRLDARDDGYLAYAELPSAPTATMTTGDAHARFAALLADLEHAATLAERCLSLLTPGPINVKLAKIVKVPEGTYYGEVAAPWGTAGCHLVSRGDRTPWRLGLRTPTFANCSALASALVGCPVEAVGDVVASLGYGIGDLDR